MQPYRADRMVGALTALVSVAYFSVLVVGGVALAALPLAKAITSLESDPPAADERKLTLGWNILVSPRDARETVQTAWGPLDLVVDHAIAKVQFSVEAIPWGGFAFAWANLAVLMGLLALTLYHLRRIFQRVRDGAPFDAQNAVRMRTVGLLMLAGVVQDSAMQLVLSKAVLGGVHTGEIALSRWVYVDPTGIFIALVMIALAEVFRRGAELEDEQSLVV